MGHVSYRTRFQVGALNHQCRKCTRRALERNQLLVHNVRVTCVTWRPSRPSALEGFRTRESASSPQLARGEALCCIASLLPSTPGTRVPSPELGRCTLYDEVLTPSALRAESCGHFSHQPVGNVCCCAAQDKRVLPTGFPRAWSFLKTLLRKLSPGCLRSARCGGFSFSRTL